MRIRFAVYVLGVSLLTALSLVAQDYPKVEIPFGFSFVNVHPNLTPITSFNIFGGGGQFDYNIGPIVGIKGDFMGYTQGNGLKTRLTNAGYTIFGDVQGNLFTYMFGPQFKKHTGNWQPFGEALFGAAHSVRWWAGLQAGEKRSDPVRRSGLPLYPFWYQWNQICRQPEQFPIRWRVEPHFWRCPAGSADGIVLGDAGIGNGRREGDGYSQWLKLQSKTHPDIWVDDDWR